MLSRVPVMLLKETGATQKNTINSITVFFCNRISVPGPVDSWTVTVSPVGTNAHVRTSSTSYPGLNKKTRRVTDSF